MDSSLYTILKNWIESNYFGRVTIVSTESLDVKFIIDQSVIVEFDHDDYVEISSHYSESIIKLSFNMPTFFNELKSYIDIRLIVDNSIKESWL